MSSHYQPLVQPTLDWADHSPSSSGNSALDMTILDSLMQDLSHYRPILSEPASADLPATPSTEPLTAQSDRPEAKKRSKIWTEEEKRAWIKRRISFKSFGGPEYLRKSEWVFPDEPWLKLMSPIIWENQKARDLINSQIFDGKLRFIDLKALPGMGATIRRKTAAMHPSQRLPFVRIPAETLGLTGKVSGPYRVHISDHGYEGKTKGTKVKGTALEGKAYLGFFGLPENQPQHKVSMFFFGMGFLPDSEKEHVDRFLQQKELEETLRQGVSR
ncbi:hypothetical protein EX895_004994 [Sporisorium graminicola]|uniref:Uncharacterized protein n=1 Tax=Sporisorium graminicola TaxID=280036 RepID=A0A4V6YEM1_9BASI|nr:hypothetical protein EX895_004994 [Sporisorium graminicola]TKY86169.1 hypothetical protein EX895_004994 [Sporisorium graminicola]